MRTLLRASGTRTKKTLIDEHFMRVAIQLARRGQGSVAPNPSVGCVIVKDDKILGRGWTQSGGRPHAETEAIRRAEKLSVGATAYVTLEPCAHQGETRSCAQALLDAGISRVVMGVRDPDPRVDGRGVKLLSEAGVIVTEGICSKEAEEVAAGFFSRIRLGRPLVTVKVATSLDGKIATASGQSKWITGSLSRAIGHGLRARYDAVLVGGHTAYTDNPSLTCRLPGLEQRSPIRIVMDGQDELPKTHVLLSSGREVPTWIMMPRGLRQDRQKRYREQGAEIIEIDVDPENKINLELALSVLGRRGITRLMVEGGGKIISRLLQRRLVDRLVWFRSPRIIGADGVSVPAALGTRTLDEALNLVKLSDRSAGDDMIETYGLSL